MEYPNYIKYTREHVWVLVEENTAKIGVTDYAQDQLGDILYVDLPEIDTVLSAGDVFTELESSKTTTEVPTPISGEVINVNEDLDDSPELINDDPYGAWIVEISISDPDELEELLSADEYEIGLE